MYGSIESSNYTAVKLTVFNFSTCFTIRVYIRCCHFCKRLQRLYLVYMSIILIQLFDMFP